MASSAFSQMRRTVRESAPWASMRETAALMILSLFSHASTQYTNIFDALRLTKFAQEKGKTEIIKKLFDAYFTKNLELSDHKVLMSIAAECGLEEKKTAEVLESGRYGTEVRADEREAMERGIDGVPYFLINGKYTASGAQPVEVLQEALAKIIAEEKAVAPATESLEGMTCGPNGCRF